MKALLFCGMMYHDKSVFKEAVKLLEDRFGEIESASKPYEFTFTDYYEKEMGRELKKRFIVFKKPIDRGLLADIKILTNGLEKEFLVDGKRQINLDPGYVTRANVVLATTKEFPHRVYLADGIFGEVTLQFARDGCKHLEWTYPDFRTDECCNFFSEVRSRL
jgi:hypothetical protein